VAPPVSSASSLLFFFIREMSSGLTSTLTESQLSLLLRRFTGGVLSDTQREEERSIVRGDGFPAAADTRLAILGEVAGVATALPASLALALLEQELDSTPLRCCALDDFNAAMTLAACTDAAGNTGGFE
jgi:hypothetical protein